MAGFKYPIAGFKYRIAASSILPRITGCNNLLTSVVWDKGGLLGLLGSALVLLTRIRFQIVSQLSCFPSRAVRHATLPFRRAPSGFAYCLLQITDMLRK